MEIEEAVTGLLTADAQLVALIGGADAPRLYPQDAPQSAECPLVLYVTNDPEQQRSLRGYLNAYSQTFRFDCYADGGQPYSQAKAVAKRLRAVLLGLAPGTLIGGGAIKIRSVGLAGGEDGLQEPLFADQEGADYVAVFIRIAWETV